MTATKNNMHPLTAVISLLAGPLAALHGGALLWVAGLGPYGVCAFTVFVVRMFGVKSWREAPTEPWQHPVGALTLLVLEHVLLGGACWLVLFVARGVVA